MQRVLSILLLLFLAVSLPTGAFAGKTPLPAELLQAKAVYIQTTNVNHAEYAEPYRDELKKWGRFKVVDDPKDADLIFRISNLDNTSSAYIDTGQVRGRVATGDSYTVLDVVQPSSGKVLWSEKHSWGRSWNAKSARIGALKQLRKHVEEREKSNAAAK
jgi:hypothetical protein